MKIIGKNWTFIIFVVASIAILTALIAQYNFNLLPCKMCLYQRYSYYALIIISGIFLILKNNDNKVFYLTAEILIIIGLFFAIWHVAIENNIISGLEGCSFIIENINDFADLKDYISKGPIVFCNEVNWSFLGISFALYNSVLQIVLLSINTVYLFKK